ncbi:MAG: iron-sulfur protein [Epulopiscium sp. Nele67-Bin001]|nr:MAG: iron-sulfur protein [Epulopiscium sp. Nuni2H_MBin001]OON93857.1 MAG: iron-sulfur protein [Epulopiscium sp. Nele67-Bin001]
MNILILNGSPKGKNSVTLQTARYLEKRFPEHTYHVLDVARQIKKYEKDFTEAFNSLLAAQLIIFTYPVYTCLVPYQLHRFIELIKESDISFKGKVATQITTSKHFYDMTAHRFVEENCNDLGLNFIRGLSADMDDLQTTKGQEEADCFFEKVMFDIHNKIYEPLKIVPKKIGANYKAHLYPHLKKQNANIVLVTNIAENDSNLRNMIDEVKNISPFTINEINIREYPFKGGCLGCFSCTITEKCIYKDGFDEYLRTDIQSADAILYAFTIENHYTHSSFKCYEDRQFCNGHRVVTHGKVTGYIISGNYKNEHNVQTIVEGRTEVSGMYLCGIATDEGDTERNLKNFVNSLTYCMEHPMSRPQNFYGVGGAKIFRDLVYLMQGLMQADHKFYKKSGAYDFPHNKKAMMIGMKALGFMMRFDVVQKELKVKMNEYILMPYTKVIDNTKPKK